MLEGAYPIRTDLALESRENLSDENGNLKGVEVREEKKDNSITINTVSILTENAAKNMGRPKGEYITIEAPDMAEDDEGGHREISLQLANVIRRIMPTKLRERLVTEQALSVLIVGLGNRDVTPDALGPKVVDQLFITRHILHEYGKYAYGNEHVNSISGIVPGVMAQTGMECLEIIRGVVKETKPDFIITVDALAARSVRRLGRTIQLTDTGITPGSGVGNHRDALNEKSLGIPVIALGVPTVVDAATIVADSMNSFITSTKEASQNNLDDHEKRELALELMAPQLNGMFVTPKDIDDSIRRLSFLIAEGINIAMVAGKR